MFRFRWFVQDRFEFGFADAEQSGDVLDWYVACRPCAGYFLASFAGQCRFRSLGSDGGWGQAFHMALSRLSQ